MYGAEGLRCEASGSPSPIPAAGLRRHAIPCPSCGQALWFAFERGAWPEHWVAPPGPAPSGVVHRNDGEEPAVARDASCVACSRCDHEPDDPRCFDFCSSPSPAAWLPMEAAWACDNCGCPVVSAGVKAAALEQYLATQHAQRAAQLSLVAAVAGTWLALGADAENLALARATLESQQASLELLRRSRDAGIGSDLEVSQAEIQTETARAALAQWNGQLAVDRHALDVLAGATVPAELLPDQLAEVVDAGTLAPGLPSDVLLLRPDILAAEHQLMSANANIGAARAAFFPRISLTAAFGTMSPQLSGLFGAGTRTWSFVPLITTPLWAGGFQRATLKAAWVDRNIAVAQYEKAIQVAFAEVSDGLALRATLLEQRQAQQALVAALETNQRLSTARFEAGIDGYLGVLVAQLGYFRGQQALVGVRFAEQANLVTLYKALGGGV